MDKSKMLLLSIIGKIPKCNSKVKIAKLQYLSDFIHFAFNDRPISEQKTYYTRREYGPLSSTFNSDLEWLVQNGYLKRIAKYEFASTGKTGVALDESETKTVDYIVKRYGNNSYKELVDISHRQSPFMSTKDDGVIPYFTAYDLVDDHLDYAK